MRVKKSVPLIITDKVEEQKNFYCENFGFHPLFDNGDYLALASNDGSCEIAFMKPCKTESTGEKINSPKSLIFCFEVDNTDVEYARLCKKGIEFIQVPQDNPWGDRSAILSDTIGISIYIYNAIPMTEEFSQFVKE